MGRLPELCDARSLTFADGRAFFRNEKQAQAELETKSRKRASDREKQTGSDGEGRCHAQSSAALPRLITFSTCFRHLCNLARRANEIQNLRACGSLVCLHMLIMLMILRRNFFASRKAPKELRKK